MNRLSVWAIILLAAAVRFPAVFFPHIENDEVIYRVLAEKLTREPLDFSLRGTALLNELPAAQYDHPIFRHPPFFFYLLALLYKCGGVPYGILLPLAFNLLTVFFGMKIARYLGTQADELITGILLAVCPLMIFGASRLWIDAPYTALITAAFYFFITAYDRADYKRMLLAGMIMGLSLLTKYSAAGILPALAAYALLKRSGFKNTLACSALFTCAALVVFLPWLCWYYAKMGTLSTAMHFAPTADYLARFPVVRKSYEQPAYFYFLRLAEVAPVYLWAVYSGIKEWGAARTKTMLIWGLSFLGGFSLLSLAGPLGSAVRYVLPASVPLAILSARAFTRMRPVILLLAVLLCAYQLVNGIVNSYLFIASDPVPLFEYLARIK